MTELHEIEQGGGQGHSTGDAQSTSALPSSQLDFCADFLDDVERLRLATENRIRALEQGKDHEMRVNPSLAGTPWYANMAAQLEAIEKIEHEAELDLKRAMRQHPLGEWVKRTTGIGEKQGARLIAAIGDPLSYVDRETGETVNRTVSKLWAYCGYSPDQKRQRGVRSNWSNDAKMRAFLCAQSCIKNVGEGNRPRSPYRDVYEAEREKWKDRETTDLHKHNHALRIVAKEILKDLWREARAIEAAETTTVTPESQAA